MPKTKDDRTRLLAALLRKYGDRPSDAERALGLPANTVHMWKNRKVIPYHYVETVRAHLYGAAARPVQPANPNTMNEQDARLLREFTHIILRTPGMRDVLLGLAMAPEDRKVLADTIERVEAETL